MSFSIVLVGPYNSDNVGDFAMLFGFIIKLSRAKCIDKIYILTNKNKGWLLNLIKKELKYIENKDIIDKISVVNYRKLLFLLKPKKVWIFGGGTILLPSILSGKNIIILVKYFFLPLLVRIMGNKVIFYSVDGFPSFLAKIASIFGKVYTRSYILHKKYNYKLILDVAKYYFNYLLNIYFKRCNKIRIFQRTDENNPDINKYNPHEFYYNILVKRDIITYRYHTALFCILANKRFKLEETSNINKLRLKSLIRAYKIKTS